MTENSDDVKFLERNRASVAALNQKIYKIVNIVNLERKRELASKIFKEFMKLYQETSDISHQNCLGVG